MGCNGSCGGNGMNKYDLLKNEGLSDAQIGRVLGQMEARGGRGGSMIQAGGFLKPGVVSHGSPVSPATGLPQRGAPQPGACGSMITSAEGEPWMIASSTTLSAGAQSANTDLAEVFDASQSTQISTDNQVPDFIEISHIRIYLGVIGVNDGGVENAGFFGNLFLRETIGSGGGQEIGIYDLGDLGAVVGSFGGYGTSTGTASLFYELSVAGAAFPRTYEPRETYSLAFRLSTAFTTVNDVVFSTKLVGRRATARK